MEKDIVPELLNRIQDDFERNMKTNVSVVDSLKSLKTGKVGYLNANEYSIGVGDALSNALLENVTVDILPDGKMYYNIADRVLNETMGKAHGMISDYSTNVQSVLNKKAKLGIKGLKAPLNQDRIDGIVNKIALSDTFDNVSWLMNEPIKNFCQSIVDDTIKVNVEHHYKLGLRPKIKRVSTGHCCDWCDNIQGSYEYPDNVPDDIYRRHRYCRCTVDYYPGDGKKQNVHSKRWSDIKDVKKYFIESKGKYQKNAKLKRIATEIAIKKGYNPLPQSTVVDILRKESDDWILLLSEAEKKSITKYTFNGVDDNKLKLYQKINGFLEGYYTPETLEEQRIILRSYGNIRNGILNNDLKNDIIVYRRDTKPSKLHGKLKKFLSSSVTPKGTFGENPNVAIIVPKGSNGAYIEKLSDENFKKQREFLLNVEVELELLISIDNMSIYIVNDRGE